jgi:hypothetical protein
MVGLHPHHHGESSAETICVHDCDHHTEADHDIPCSQDCLIELPDVDAFAIIQFTKSPQPELLPTEIVNFGNLDSRNLNVVRTGAFRPPGWLAELAGSERTGRFLF